MTVYNRFVLQHGDFMDRQRLTEIISDPFDGPFDGIDYFIDDDDTIYVIESSPAMAGLIAHRVNKSGAFPQKLIRLGLKGGGVVLGFDTLAESSPIFTIKIGYGKDILAEVKETEDGKFCFYLNKRRSSKMFKTLLTTKRYLKKLDREMVREYLGLKDDDYQDDIEEDEVTQYDYQYEY